MQFEELLTVYDIKQISDWKVKGCIMDATNMGATFVKYVYIQLKIYLIVPRSSELYNSVRGVKGITEAINMIAPGHRVFIKYID